MILFEFQLDNDILGPKIISECDGWKDAKLKLERDKNFKGIIEYFDGSFIFYGNNGQVDGGIDYINEVELTQGFDAEIRIRILLSLDGGYHWSILFVGQLNLALSQRFVDNKIQIPIIRDDFWAKFINRLDTPVDIQSNLSLDGVDINNFDSINLRLTSQKIQKKQNSSMAEMQAVYEDEWISSQYLQIGFDTNELDEIKESFDIPTGVNPDVPVYILAADEEGDYNFDIRIEVSSVSYVVTGSGDVTNCSLDRDIDSTETIINFYIQKNSETPILFTVTNASLILTDRSSWYTYNGNYNLKKGDTVKFYGSLIAPLDNGDVDNFVIWGRNNVVTLKTPEIGFDLGTLDCFWTGDTVDFPEDLGDAPSTVDNPTYFNITAQTIAPNTNAFAFLIHDVAGQVCDRYTSVDNSFYSEHLGSQNTIYKQYEGDGCGWKYAIAKGLQIRRYSLIEKPFFMSFNQWWKGINPVLCLGLGYEEVNGSQVIRIEEMEHFYDATSTSFDISNVRQINRIYDQEVIFKTVKIGYSKWQSEDISGIDDAQTKHTYATRFVKTGNDLVLESDFIGASLAIETTRRATRIKSADYKFDNDTFLIAINPDPTSVVTSPNVTDYLPELDENFSSITNLLNSETRYNSRITPARNLMRWIRYISGGLQSYLDSKFKFVSGEGNYDMTSDMINTSDGCSEIKTDVSEKEDLPVYNDPLHLAMLYEIIVPMEWEEYLLIRENRKKAIGISQTTTGHVKFFIESLEYELVQSKATIKAWPVEFFEIRVIDDTPQMRACVPIVTENCDDSYLTEDSFEFETENGQCLILN